MRKKSVFLSKVFAVALAASMAFSTPYASAALVDSAITYEGDGLSVTTKQSGWWAGWSDFYRVSGDFDVTIEFSNKSNGATVWNNYLLVFTAPVDYAEGDPNNISGYQEYCVLRADNWGWGGGDNKTSEGNDITYSGLEIDDSYAAVMADAKVSLNIVRTGNDVTINAIMVGANSTTLNKTTTFKLTPESVNFFVTGEAADVNILSYTVKKNNGVEISQEANLCDKIEFEDSETTRVIGVPFELKATLIGKDKNKAVTDEFSIVSGTGISYDKDEIKKSGNTRSFEVTPIATQAAIVVKCGDVEQSYTFEAVENKVTGLVSSKGSSFTATADQETSFVITANADYPELPIKDSIELLTCSALSHRVVSGAVNIKGTAITIYTKIKEGINNFEFKCGNITLPVTVTGIKGSGTTTPSTPDTTTPDDTNKPNDTTTPDDTNKPNDTTTPDDTNKPDDSNTSDDNTNTPSDNDSSDNNTNNSSTTTTTKKKASIKSATAKKGKKVVSGTIKLSSGKVVKKATVKVYVNSKKKTTVTTNSKGKFTAKLSKKLKKGDKVKIVVTKTTIKKITKTITVK